MARGIKCRRVCAEPKNKLFRPENTNAKYITLNVEELEALRLCDLEGLDQDAAAKRMNISRGTLQRILYVARKLTAEALVKGNGINIEGGNYEVARGYCKHKKSCKYCKFTENTKGDELSE